MSCDDSPEVIEILLKNIFRLLCTKLSNSTQNSNHRRYSKSIKFKGFRIPMSAIYYSRQKSPDNAMYFFNSSITFRGARTERSLRIEYSISSNSPEKIFRAFRYIGLAFSEEIQQLTLNDFLVRYKCTKEEFQNLLNMLIVDIL